MDATGSGGGTTDNAAGSAAPLGDGAGGTEAREEMGAPSIPWTVHAGSDGGERTA
jgi:hypothetical protein